MDSRKVILVDDEPGALRLLQGYLDHFDDMRLLATFRNGIKAFEYLSQNPVDLVFLDINMPHLDGIALSQMIPSRTKVVFTTAYSEFAVQSYEVNAVDYLLKPISLERFTQAIKKVRQLESIAPTTEYILVKSGSKTYRLEQDNIEFLKKDGNYITYHTRDEEVLGRLTVQEALSQLPSHFVQVHKSYIVNTRFIRAFDKEFIEVPGASIPIGASFRTEVTELLSNL